MNGLTKEQVKIYADFKYNLSLEQIKVYASLKFDWKQMLKKEQVLRAD